MEVISSQLPTLYEHYTAGGISSGLSVDRPFFTLNERNITLYSGAMHYFRVPKEYWRDRLRKMRAAGLNAVETYVPWNLHEPEQGFFDFGKGGSDMERLLDVEVFLRTAQEEDLLAIVRPGPFICSEWEFGGLPSWLLRDKGLKVRTSQPEFMAHVTRFFNVLLPILANLQFVRGGPIIGFQVENEYGSTEQKNKFVPDKRYLWELRSLFLTNNITELLFTSDSPTLHGTAGTLPGVLFQTANFANKPEWELDRLKQLQPNKPSMAMEYWTGWFDHWSENHHTRNDTDFQDNLERILKYPASVNMYMFEGGTSWGFYNGANIAGSGTDNEGFQPDTTSYDYDAPLTEAGDYTMKYIMVKNLLKKYNTIPTRLPQAPTETSRRALATIDNLQQLLFWEITQRLPRKYYNSKPLPMELLPSGQSFGYLVYRKEHLDIPANSILMIKGRVCDTVTVLVNGVLVSPPLKNDNDLNGFGYWKWKDSQLKLDMPNVTDATLELIAENWGRNNFGSLDQFVQHKGLWQGGIYLNSREIFDWEMIPLEFKTQWTNALTGWHLPADMWLPAPALYKATFSIDQPEDTYVDMRSWTKGIVIINGFVLGRYASTIGPQQTLYLPAPFMRKGLNELVIFEHFKAGDHMKFSEDPVFHTPKNKGKL